MKWNIAYSTYSSFFAAVFGGLTSINLSSHHYLSTTQQMNLDPQEQIELGNTSCPLTLPGFTL